MAKIGWGDELMVTGKVREMQEKDSRPVVIVYERVRWHEAFDNNPRIVKYGTIGDFQYLIPRDSGLRPYCSKKESDRWTWKPYKPPRGELFFYPHEKAFGDLHKGHVIIEPNIKSKASPNKQWGQDKWQELARILDAAGVPLAQVGPSESVGILPGVRKFIQTTTMRLAAAVVSKSRAVVCPEGALHHAAATFRIPAVVIYGGYISPEVTGYDDQVSIYTGGEGLGCGMRTNCGHCREAMEAITPRRVAGEVLRILG